MINFVYLAHSQERFIKQAVFSVLSLLEYLSDSTFDSRVIVYTDQPDYFSRLKVETVLIGKAELKEWRGSIDFVHRMKICVLQDTAKRFDGRFFYLDTDNCAFQSPISLLKQWRDDTVFMSSLEYVLENPGDLVGKKYKRFFKKQSHFIGKVQSYEVTLRQECWNAGVIGLPREAIKYLPDVLALCDEMHKAFPKHLSEQMAFNIVMGHHFQLVGFSDFSYHWFGHGQAINKIIDSVLIDYPSVHLDELIENVRQVKQEVIDSPLNPDKLPWYKRWFK